MGSDGDPRRDGRYAREFLAGWRTMDFNGHMANTAYLDLAADVRMAFFAEHGFPPAEFHRLALGPVVRKDEVEYFREIGLHETVTVTLAVTAMRPPSARRTAGGSRGCARRRRAPPRRRCATASGSRARPASRSPSAPTRG